MRQWRDRRSKQRRLDDTSIVDQLRRLPPLQQPPYRELVVATRSGWTAYFDNSILGGDPVSWVGHLSRQLNCQGVIAVHIPPEQYTFPATQFELLGPTGEEPLRYVRTVSAGIFDEGRWRFDAWGAEQPFEETAAYTRRPARDRLTRDMLLRYLAALGIDADEPSFYGDGVLFERRAWKRPRTMTLAEARREYEVAGLTP